MEKGRLERKINELRAEAREMGIRLVRSMKKQDILEAIEKKERVKKTHGKKVRIPRPEKTENTQRTGTVVKRVRNSPAAPRIQTAASTKRRPGRIAKTSPKNSMKSPLILARKGTNAPAQNTGIREIGTSSPQPALPEEYGDNDLLFIVVDPDVVYASWEIRPEDFPQGNGGLKMRLLDVTEGQQDGRQAGYPDIALRKRIGNGFFNLRMHGRDIVAEIGHYLGGSFAAIARSARVSFPMPCSSEEPMGAASSDEDTPIGY